MTHLGATLFALESTLGALKYFLDGLDFAPPDQGGLFFLGKGKLIIDRYDITHGLPYPN
jgi:hypothetical protein